MESTFCYRHLSVVEATSTITSHHSALFCLLWSIRITVSYSWMQVDKEEFEMKASSGIVNCMRKLRKIL